MAIAIIEQAWPAGKPYLDRIGAQAVEWPTLALILGCQAGWLIAGLLYAHAHVSAIVLLALTITLHSSLQHEIIHRHPTRWPGWNELMVCLPLGLLVPFRRFRVLHLAHHQDSRLTDPYDDSESYYIAAAKWERLPRPMRWLLGWNNTMLGRMLLGPAILAARFLVSELGALVRLRGAERLSRLQAWGLHTIGLAVAIQIIQRCFAMPLLAYGAAAYGALSLLAIRSFCEHRWAEIPEERTVIVERSLLAPLFLHNNLHLVHHRLPGLPWYALPAAYHANRTEWLALNDGYAYRDYGAVLRRFALRAKEPVAHPTR